MPSILDQVKKYHALKQFPTQRDFVQVPDSLLRPKAQEFFDAMMKNTQVAPIDAENTRTEHKLHILV